MSKNNTKSQEVQTTTQVEVVEQPFNMEAAVKEHGSISAVIRHLAKTHKRGEIAKMTGKRYQHVRNVLIQPLKKA